MYKGKLTFGEVLKDIRGNLNQITEMSSMFLEKASFGLWDEETRSFFYDILMDKIYETNEKIRKFNKDLGFSPGNPDFGMEHILSAGQRILRHGLSSTTTKKFVDMVNGHILSIEESLSTLRRVQHGNDWKKLEKIKPLDYVIEKRKKFISAKEELSIAKKAIEKKDWVNVNNHLRTAIDLAFKEKFGFKKIHPMFRFLKDATKYDLPLPAYDLIYSFFDMGSKRLHDGKIHTPWEAKQSLRIVTDFIGQLDLIEVDQKTIDDFKIKCKFVK